MLGLGTLLGCDEFAIPCTPTSTKDIKEVHIKNGKYEKFYVTKEIDGELDNSFPDDYGFNTILYAQFDKNSSNAGNVDWELNNVSHILIKKKEKGTFNWTTIAVQEVTDIHNIEVFGVDYTCAAKTTYAFAVVPSFYGIEGNYDIEEIDSDFDEFFFISKDGLVHTSLSDGFLNTTNNTPSSTLITINDRFPTKVRNTCANYKTGSFTGSFFYFDEELCDYDLSDRAITNMQNEVISFLSDGNPKLIKHFDGRVLLVSIDDSISNNANGHYKNRQISFNFTEMGDANSSEDLYMAGLSDVTEEWW